MTIARMTTIDGNQFQVSWDGSTSVVEGLEGPRLEEFMAYMTKVHGWMIGDPIPEDSPNMTVGYTIEHYPAASEFEMLWLAANSPSKFKWIVDMQPDPPLPE